MHLGIRSERNAGERRVAVTPQTIEAYADIGVSVVVERGAGDGSGLTDAMFESAGATVVASLDTIEPVDILATVGPVAPAAVPVADGGVVIGLLDPVANEPDLVTLRRRGVTAIAMESVPRTTLAQSMDALSSQATAAGYAAVLLGATEMPKFMPMLVTAAGTVPPAKVLVLGVGVAGLQAIATAKRLGAVVSAYDIRPETKEQVESLGAKFVDAPTQAMDEGGYARAIDESTAEQQREILSDVVAASDLVVTTAQVPGRKAPNLIDEEMVGRMQAGTVVIDMAAGSGGNVTGSRPDETVVTPNGVTIHGPTDLAGRVAADASRMYARNILEVIQRIVVDGAIELDPTDAVVGPAIVGATAVVETGKES